MDGPIRPFLFACSRVHDGPVALRLEVGGGAGGVRQDAEALAVREARHLHQGTQLFEKRDKYVTAKQRVDHLQGGASYLSQDFVMFSHASFEGLPGQ